MRESPPSAASARASGLEKQMAELRRQRPDWGARKLQVLPQRHPVEALVTLSRPGMTEVRAHVGNISEGGIAIVTTAVLKPGIEVRVECILPGYASPFVTDSAICWCREGHKGLQFISLSMKVRAKLHDWLSRSLDSFHLGNPGFSIALHS